MRSIIYSQLFDRTSLALVCCNGHAQRCLHHALGLSEKEEEEEENTKVPDFVFVTWHICLVGEAIVETPGLNDDVSPSTVDAVDKGNRKARSLALMTLMHYAGCWLAQPTFALLRGRYLAHNNIAYCT